MRTLWKVAAAAFALGALSALGAPANAQDYGNGYGPPPGYDNGDPAGDGNGYGPPPGYGNGYSAGYGNGYGPGDMSGYAQDPACDPANYAPDETLPSECYTGGGYCDQYGCPDDYYNLPVYYGPVFYDDTWYNGPIFYRDGYGGRQYWLHGGWHSDQWRGARPSWWNASRYHTRAALGRNYYQSHSFRGGNQYDRGGWNCSGAHESFRGQQGGAYGNAWNGQRYNGAMDRRTSFGTGNGSGRSWQQQPQQQAAPQVSGRSWNGSGYGGGHNWGGGGFRAQQQSAPQAAPQASAGRSFGGGGHSWGGNGGGGRSFNNAGGNSGGGRSFSNGGGGGHSYSGGGGGGHSYSGGGGGGGGGNGNGGGHGHR